MIHANPAKPPDLRHTIMAGFTGNVVEWYDFALYRHLAGTIAPIFFPSGNATAGQIASPLSAPGFAEKMDGSEKAASRTDRAKGPVE